MLLQLAQQASKSLLGAPASPARPWPQATAALSVWIFILRLPTVSALVAQPPTELTAFLAQIPHAPLAPTAQG